MSFIVILICLSAQWFLSLSSTPYQKEWATHYVSWMRKQFVKLFQGHGMFAVLTLVLPIVIVVSLLFTLIYHLLGHLGYLIASLVLLWYCTDMAGLRKTAGITGLSSSEVFIQSYQKLFAPLFWYFVFGPVGLTLYVAVCALRSHSQDQKYFVLTQGVLDWVPVRLMGLSFALAGNFAAVFKEWVKVLFQGITDNQEWVVTWGNIALAAEKSESDAVALTHRVLLIWLVIMALITIGSFY
ncbi:MAG: hypothetical protein A3C44_06860 [Gammaproteobacteria bacterium RIFCSPHIGHO2_02_FULL_39_13]|nr:MAG: hypothetical protein A3C44_06860 [Gammaproteobacteria bacterium RIFCSPHIGHO2_02_FULL_39_13]OGT48155.1 MAG: hypothetical protein A3E53_03075 [Gammaproteobacteria bacterium RIFCSPHIGHO2_12_FULL_39_24]